MRHLPRHSRAATLGAVLLIAACGDPAARVPDADVLVVTSAAEDEVRLLDPATGEMVGRVPVGDRRRVADRAAGVAVAGDRWYVVLGSSQPAVWSFEGTGTEPASRLPLPELRHASRVAVSPDGERVAVSEYFLGDARGDGRIALGEGGSGDVRTATVCPAPYGLAWSRGSRLLAITCPMADAVYVLGGDSLETRGRFVATSPDVQAGLPGNPASRPMGVGWSAAGDRIFVALYRERRLGVFTGDGAHVRSVDLGGHPVSLKVTGRGRYVVVVTRQDPTLTVVDVRSGEAVAMPLPDADSPHDLALSPDGRTAYVAWEGTQDTPGGVTAVDLDAGAVLWTRQTAPMTTGIAYRPAPSSSGAPAAAPSPGG